MTTLVTALNGAAVITTATAPTMGNINSYNASGGAISNTLPALSGLNVGASCLVEKWQTDGTLNAVSFTSTASDSGNTGNTTDTFDDGSTSFALVAPGDKAMLQVISISGVKYWKRMTAGSIPKIGGGLASLAAPVTLVSSTALTTLITTTLPAGFLYAGALFRLKIAGTIQTQVTSGILTFTPQIQGTALGSTAAIASTASANAASPFFLEYLITCRTTGASGTALASPYGIVNLATTGVVYLTSTVTTATTVNTTAAAGSNVLQLQAQWATSSATNSLIVTSGLIEHVV